MVELRWKMKTRKNTVPTYPDQYGGPTHEVTELYEVLEYRVADTTEPRRWLEVPHVGLD